MNDDNEWAEILITYDELEASIVKDVLESEDIQVLEKSSKITPYPVSIGKLGEIKLSVRHEDLERAEQVLKIMEEVNKEEFDETGDP